MNKASVHYLDPVKWTDLAVAVVMGAVEQICNARGSCSMMLTGGRTAERLYLTWSASPRFKRLSNVRFYFSDERCVPPDHPDSNYGLAMRTLFQNGVPHRCTVIRIEAEQVNRAAAAAAYENQLPVKLDVLLLSVGEDGHIASLFPKSKALSETRRRVLAITAPKPPYDRLTVTPAVIAEAAHIFVMAIGDTRAALFKKAQAEPQAFEDLPARLVLDATWLLDSQCAQ